MLSEMNQTLSSKIDGPERPIPFIERERLMSLGLMVYVDNMVGEYLDRKQLSSFVDMLKNFRFRPADVIFSRSLCVLISAEKNIRNRYIPRKCLQKNELAILFYNLAPYALLSRQSAAAMAKESFPNFFGTIGTINSTFTKYQPVGANQSPQPALAITNLPIHSTSELEQLLLRMGIEENNSKKYGTKENYV